MAKEQWSKRLEKPMVAPTEQFHHRDTLPGTGLPGLGEMSVTPESVGTAESAFQLTGIPVLRPARILTGNKAVCAYRCVTAALQAFPRGWGGW